MNDIIELNRMEFMILNSLYNASCTNPYHSMAITDLINDNEGVLGARMTVYRKMQKLTNAGYIKKDALITMLTHFISWKRASKQSKEEKLYEFKEQLQIYRFVKLWRQTGKRVPFTELQSDCCQWK